MQGELISALWDPEDPPAHGYTTHGLAKEAQKAVAKMDSVAAEIGRVLAIAKDDGTRQLVKRAKGKRGRDPFLTEAEVDILEASVAQIEECRHDFKCAFTAASILRHRGGKRQQLHTASKKHCRHCNGRKTVCDCKEGCIRPEKSNCYDKNGRAHS